MITQKTDAATRIGSHPEQTEVGTPHLSLHGRTGRVRVQRPRIDTQVSIRVASPGDTEGLRGMFARASAETIYRRFLSPYRTVPEWMLALMLGTGQHDMKALVAVAEEEVIGHAMYSRLGNSTEAEMAIVVEDGWQSRGVGKSLLRRLAEDAGSRGIETFVGVVLPENRRMFGLIDAVFTGSRRVIVDDVLGFRAPLRKREPVEPIGLLSHAA